LGNSDRFFTAPYAVLVFRMNKLFFYNGLLLHTPAAAGVQLETPDAGVGMVLGRMNSA